MENSPRKYWFYRVFSVFVLAALVFLLKHDLKRMLDPTLSPSSPQSQQVVPPDIYFFSPDSTSFADGSLRDLFPSVKPTVPLYRFSKVIKPNIQKNLDTSGLKVEKISLKKPDKSGTGTGFIQQEQSDTEIFFDLPDFTTNVGFSWVANNQGVADFDLTQQNNRQLSPSIVQVYNNLDYNEVGLNNELDDQIVGSFGNRRIITQIGVSNYLNQTLYNTYASDFIVRSIGNSNTTIQNVFNAYNARLNVVQNGSFNRVRQDIFSRTAFGTLNGTVNDVRQIGTDNLFSSQQAGISNTIEAIQLGNFNNVDITQEGNNNSVNVRQSGSGNTVSIQQN
jgi:hypothetical protein